MEKFLKTNKFGECYYEIPAGTNCAKETSEKVLAYPVRSGHSCTFGDNVVFQAYSEFGAENLFLGHTKLGSYTKVGHRSCFKRSLEAFHTSVFAPCCTFEGHTVLGLYSEAYKPIFMAKAEVGSCCLLTDVTSHVEMHIGEHARISDGWLLGRNFIHMSAKLIDSVSLERADSTLLSKGGEDLGFLRKRKGYPVLCLQGAGSRNGKVVAWHTDKGIWVSAGCFDGTLEEFEKKFKQDAVTEAPLGSYPDKAYVGDKKLQQYTKFVELIKASWL